MKKLAHEIEAGDIVVVNGSERVTVADVYRRDAEWISNGVVRFTATNGNSYGLDRNALVTTDEYYKVPCICGFAPPPFCGSHTQECADAHFGRN